MKYWLMKSEPTTYSIDDLEREGKTAWEGVRNFQARNFMRDEMQIGDRVLFYHSNAKVIGVAGLGRICSEAYPDATALNPSSDYYDPKATLENPIWMLRDVSFEEKFSHIVSLEEMKKHEALSSLMLLRKGMRLSIQPVEKKQFDYICQLAKAL